MENPSITTLLDESTPLPVVEFPPIAPTSNETQQPCTPVETREEPTKAQSAPVEAVLPAQEQRKAKPYFGFETYTPVWRKLKREQPHHRHINSLLAEGCTIKEVAQATGFAPQTVAYTKKQPFSQDYIAEQQDSKCRQEITAILSGAALKAAETLVAVMNGEIDEKCLVRDRAKAANDILDRILGTAPQTVNVQRKNLEEMSDEELQKIARGIKN